MKNRKIKKGAENSKLLLSAYGNKALSLNDILRIKSQYSSFTSEQTKEAARILKSDIERKMKEYKHKVGLESIINPLEDIKQDNQLEHYIRAWIRSEYITRDRELWERFDNKEIEFDTLIMQSASVFNELYSHI